VTLRGDEAGQSPTYADVAMDESLTAVKLRRAAGEEQET